MSDLGSNSTDDYVKLCNALDKITSLQRELEEVRKEHTEHLLECSRFPRQLSIEAFKQLESVGADKGQHGNTLAGMIQNVCEQLAASEAKIERMKALIDRIACSNHPKYVNCEVAWQEIAGTCAAMRDEPPSTSLDLYHKERNKKELGEVVDPLRMGVSLLSNHLTEAVAITNAGRGHSVKQAEWMITKDIRDKMQKALSILKRLTE